METKESGKKKSSVFSLAQPLILFDGVCNLCNGAVQFIILRDRKQVFSFASLQSETGQAVLNELSMDTKALQTFILIEKGKCYTKSTAGLRVLLHFGGLWNLSYVAFLIPAFIRDIVYDFISRNRYRWFGKKDACMIPTPELRKRFLN